MDSDEKDGKLPVKRICELDTKMPICKRLHTELDFIHTARCFSCNETHLLSKFSNDKISFHRLKEELKFVPN